jgi:hypothetical protein
MPESEEQNYVEIVDGIKSVSIARLEKCIADAIAKEIGGSNLNCHIAKVDTSNVNDVGLRLTVSNDYDDSDF